MFTSFLVLPLGAPFEMEFARRFSVVLYNAWNISFETWRDLLEETVCGHT